MPRILAIDYGMKRTGMAVTDPLKIIATALETVPTETAIGFLKKYTEKEPVERFVLGMPLGLDSRDTDATQAVRNFAEVLKTEFPLIPVSFHDERFTSKLAGRAMIAGGMKKKDRQVKGNLDKISAVIILQSFMESQF
ncbi:Holliday junction resolvase RuvX [Emticicia sp. CRIBPO]|uniref:Holliday junction resolvase RuvX n=1 Tax=Emticicia sp. CRIBPO TaxID=2683258 RepID=UPI00141248EC|nr:Holliday junction resolvase RuvX [Emticicia sp. CRIBPO]NBA86620.1 Holliday junction resolvase RuvX [Emticicia sp. CRIBPO]